MSVSAWRKEYEEACAKHGKDEVARAMHRPDVLESIKSGESLDTVLQSLKHQQGGAANVATSPRSLTSQGLMDQILNPTMEDSMEDIYTHISPRTSPRHHGHARESDGFGGGGGGSDDLDDSDHSHVVPPAFSSMDQSENSSAYSADSIIRRVELEIANARKAVQKSFYHGALPPRQLNNTATAAPPNIYTTSGAGAPNRDEKKEMSDDDMDMGITPTATSAGGSPQNSTNYHHRKALDDIKDEFDDDGANDPNLDLDLDDDDDSVDNDAPVPNYRSTSSQPAHQTTQAISTGNPWVDDIDTSPIRKRHPSPTIKDGSSKAERISPQDSFDTAQEEEEEPKERDDAAPGQSADTAAPSQQRTHSTPLRVFKEVKRPPLSPRSEEAAVVAAAEAAHRSHSPPPATLTLDEQQQRSKLANSPTNSNPNSTGVDDSSRTRRVLSSLRERREALVSNFRARNSSTPTNSQQQQPPHEDDANSAARSPASTSTLSFSNHYSATPKRSNFYQPSSDEAAAMLSMQLSPPQSPAAAVVAKSRAMSRSPVAGERKSPTTTTTKLAEVNDEYGKLMISPTSAAIAATKALIDTPTSETESSESPSTLMTTAEAPKPERPPSSPRRMMGRAAAFQMERPAPTSSFVMPPHSSPTLPPPSSRSSSGRRGEKSSSTPPAEPSPKSRRIRFRDPYPVLKPPAAPRPAAAIIKELACPLPDNPTRWVKPKTDLKQLIVAAMGHSLPRRANACGTLKVLTQSKKNRMTMVRTDSFLSALVFTATQDIPSFRERELAFDARTRAVACMKNVTEQKDNRVIVLTYPGVLECLQTVIHDDRNEARMLSCSTLALLAKTVACREALVASEGLVNTLAHVLAGTTVDSKLFACSKTQSSSKDEDGAANDKEDGGSVTSGASHSGGDESHSEHDDDDDDDDSQGSASTASSLSAPESVTRKKPLPLERMDSIRYKNEAMGEEFYQRSRSNTCAALLHLSKHGAVLPALCANTALMDSLIAVSRDTAVPIHSKCLEILANLTRLPANCSKMTPYDGLVHTLTLAASFEDATAREFALLALQNLSADSVSKPQLATDTILSLMTSCAMRRSPVEKEAAVATLYNLTTEPGAVVSITNTKNVVATLVHLAHHGDSTTTIRFMACEALATISLWLQTLAGTGKVPMDCPNVPLPSQKTSGWERWD